MADRIDPSKARADLDAAIAAALPIAGSQVRKRLKQLRRALDAVPASSTQNRAYLIYSRWFHAQDRSARAVYAAIQEAYAAGRDDGSGRTCPRHGAVI